jgi:hypothetical protein
MERIVFPNPRTAPRVFTFDLCAARYHNEHAQCPGFTQFDPAYMDCPEAGFEGVVLCICACHQKAKVA